MSCSAANALAASFGTRPVSASRQASARRHNPLRIATRSANAKGGILGRQVTLISESGHRVCMTASDDVQEVTSMTSTQATP